MTKNEFLQGLKEELEGRVTHSAIQENIRYYDDYISQEVFKGKYGRGSDRKPGGPRIIARTIVDAAYDTEDRPDGYDEYGSGPAEEREAGTGSRSPFGSQGNGQENPYTGHSHIHFLDFSKWYVRLGAGLVVFCVIFLIMSVFFGIVGLAGFILAHIWPVLVILMIIWMFRGPRR